MKILGWGGPDFICDPAAAILVDGKIAAAVEEERWTREKHAMGTPPMRSIEFCLKESGIRPEEIDAAAFPWSFRASDRNRSAVLGILKDIGINVPDERVFFVEHYVAHAASAYLLSGYEDAAIMSIDSNGEFAAALFAEGHDGSMDKIKEISLQGSSGCPYSAIVKYLGFDPKDGEYKLMGMASYGDASKIDLSGINRFDGLVERFGPPRNGDELGEPYIHIAAAAQKLFEDAVVKLMDANLGEALKRTGNLVFAGGSALNVVLNRRLMSHNLIKNLFVQPASNDAGTPLGAAVYAARELGDMIVPMKDVYLGPSYTDKDIEPFLKREELTYKRSPDIEKEAAVLLKDGKVVGWFQGRMEFGPRALGNRSILANPAIRGTRDRINDMVKFRERWRPFCPSILKEYAKDIIGSPIDSPFMTMSFKVQDAWRGRIPEVVHVDGTVRPQTVRKKDNPRFYSLIKHFFEETGIPVLINTSMNRRGEPMAASPADAVNMYLGSGLDYLAIGDFLVSRRTE